MEVLVYQEEHSNSSTESESAHLQLQIGSLRRGRKPGKKNRPVEERKRQEQDPDELHKKKLEKREKEQERCKNIKTAFRLLQEKLGLPEKALLNRIDILHYATDYIKHLSSQLADQQYAGPQQDFLLTPPTQEQVSDDLMWLPDPNGCYNIEHETCDYYYPPSEAVGYGHYPYHNYYMSQLPADLDTRYNHGSDVEYSYKSTSLTPPAVPSESSSELNTWFNTQEDNHIGCPMWDDLNDCSDPVF